MPTDWRTRSADLRSRLTRSWHRWLAAGLVILCLGGLGGFLFAWSGLAPIAASSGHWPVTRWFLQFAMRNAVETRSLGVKVPDLDDRGLILKGAGHYDTGCAPCHGAPGQEQSPIVREMTPEPPFLPPKIREWQPAELFWIVKNGIKFTAMPAWVNRQREDEVWAMVAFLRELPELSPAQYRKLTQGPHTGGANADGLKRLDSVAEDVAAKVRNCARCHGADGNGRGAGAFPKLAGQKQDYLHASLKAYAEGERHSGIMQPVAVGISADMLRGLASYYADLPAGSASPEQDAAAVNRGRAIAEQGLYRKGIPACNGCHGTGQKNSYFPRLAGQYADYLALQLQLFKQGQRGGTPYSHIMEMVAKRLTRQQINDLASYYATRHHRGDE